MKAPNRGLLVAQAKRPASRGAALAALVTGYETGAWNDPVAKLRLLNDLDRIRGLLRAGEDVFDRERDRDSFVQHLVAIGCQPEGTTAVT